VGGSEFGGPGDRIGLSDIDDSQKTIDIDLVEGLIEHSISQLGKSKFRFEQSEKKEWINFALVYAGIDIAPTPNPLVHPKRVGEKEFKNLEHVFSVGFYDYLNGEAFQELFHKADLSFVRLFRTWKIFLLLIELLVSDHRTSEVIGVSDWAIAEKAIALGRKSENEMHETDLPFCNQVYALLTVMLPGKEAIWRGLFPGM
jgi:hypothetical protein